MEATLGDLPGKWSFSSLYKMAIFPHTFNHWEVSPLATAASNMMKQANCKGGLCYVLALYGIDNEQIGICQWARWDNHGNRGNSSPHTWTHSLL